MWSWPLGLSTPANRVRPGPLRGLAPDAGAARALVAFPATWDPNAWREPAPRTPFCLSSGDSCSVDLPATLSDEREDLSGEVTLQGSKGIEFGMPFGYPTSNIVLGSLVGP
jgi:hypothetical protein